MVLEFPLADSMTAQKRVKCPRVIHFEIHVDDPKRARAFSSTVFGWKIKNRDGPQDYWLIETGPQDEPGIKGGRG